MQPLIPYVLRLVRFEEGGKFAMLTLAALRGLLLERGGGKTIRLRLETGPGPAGDYIGDWGGWDKPMVVTLCGNPR